MLSLFSKLKMICIVLLLWLCSIKNNRESERINLTHCSIMVSWGIHHFTFANQTFKVEFLTRV